MSKQTKKGKRTGSGAYCLTSASTTCDHLRILERSSNYGIDLRKRTREFALSIIRLYSKLPQGEVARVLGRQILRSGTSVGAHYEEACRARSTAELISKLEVALQELEETRYWLDLFVEAEVVTKEQAQPLFDEARELVSIFVVGIKRAKQQVPRPKRKSIG